MSDKHTKELAINQSQIVAISALGANVLIIEDKTAVSHAALPFPQETGQAFDACVCCEVEAVGGDASEILEDEAGLALGAYADAVVRQGKTGGAELAGEVWVEGLAVVGAAD